jgi:hypothetical protein
MLGGAVGRSHSGQFQFFFWCRKCGAVRPPFEKLWTIPSDRSSDAAGPLETKVPDDTPTRPDLPKPGRGGFG